MVLQVDAGGGTITAVWHLAHIPHLRVHSLDPVLSLVMHRPNQGGFCAITFSGFSHVWLSSGTR